MQAEPAAARRAENHTRPRHAACASCAVSVTAGPWPPAPWSPTARPPGAVSRPHLQGRQVLRRLHVVFVGIVVPAPRASDGWRPHRHLRDMRDTRTRVPGPQASRPQLARHNRAASPLLRHVMQNWPGACAALRARRWCRTELRQEARQLCTRTAPAEQHPQRASSPVELHQVQALHPQPLPAGVDALQAREGGGGTGQRRNSALVC